jgi:hypothetical protein
MSQDAEGGDVDGDVDVDVDVDRADSAGHADSAGFVSGLELVREMAEKAGLGKQRELDARLDAKDKWLRRVNAPGQALKAAQGGEESIEELGGMGEMELAGEVGGAGQGQAGGPWPRISEVLSPSLQFEGPPVKAEELLGHEFVVLDVAKYPSQFEGQDFFVVAQVEVDGVLVQLRTGSQVVMRMLLEAKDGGSLPVAARVVKRVSAAGREYFTLE